MLVFKLYICTYSILILVLCLFLFDICLNRKPVTVYQRRLDDLHLLIRINSMYELTTHVRAAPFRPLITVCERHGRHAMIETRLLIC